MNRRKMSACHRQSYAHQIRMNQSLDFDNNEHWSIIRWDSFRLLSIQTCQFYNQNRPFKCGERRKHNSCIALMKDREKRALIQHNTGQQMFNFPFGEWSECAYTVVLPSVRSFFHYVADLLNILATNTGAHTRNASHFEVCIWRCIVMYRMTRDDKQEYVCET